MTTSNHPGETRTGDYAREIDEAAFAVAYALAKQIPSIQYIQTSYGPIDLADDPEMRDAVFDAVEAVLEFRLELAKEGAQKRTPALPGEGDAGENLDSITHGTDQGAARHEV